MAYSQPKKLFVLTCNNKYRIDEHMRNRPGRIYYMIDFDGITEEFIIEYCNDNLNNKSFIPDVCKVASVFPKFNFDMLKALVEEMNRYNETPSEALRYLNVKAEFAGNVEYDIELFVDGAKIKTEDLDSKTWVGNPLQANEIELYYSTEEESYLRAWVSAGDLESLTGKGDRYTFCHDKFKIILQRKQQASVRNYYDLL